jgi:hypothetical protein
MKRRVTLTAPGVTDLERTVRSYRDAWAWRPTWKAAFNPQWEVEDRALSSP